MNRLYEMDTRGAVSTITINVFFFIIFGYIKLNALLLSDDFFTRNQHPERSSIGLEESP